MIKNQLNGFQNFSQAPFGLGDFDISFVPKTLFGGEFDEVVVNIYERVNWNRINLWKVINPLDWDTSYQITLKVAERILSTYMNVIKNTSSYQQWSPKDSENRKALVAEIQKIAGVQRVADVIDFLDQLYWASKDGSIQNDRYINPRNNEYNDQREVPEGEDAFVNSDTMGFFEGVKSFGSNLSWMLPVGLVVAGLFVAYPYVKPLMKKG